MRIAHATDIHWFAPPRLWDLRSFKRMIGTANLYLAGRRHRFPDAVQAELVSFVASLAPDLFCLTGDLTSTALPAEFEKARRALDPLIARVPTFIIPGNHDVYTPGAARERRIERWFSEWMYLGAGGLGMHDFDGVTVIGLDPNRPTRIAGSGVVPPAQLEALAAALRRPDLADRAVVLCVHYPLYHRAGESLYEGWEHGLENAGEVVRVLTEAPRRPDLVLHGHVHHGYQGAIPLPDGARIPVFNSGSSGYTDTSKSRGAAVNVYTLAGREIVGVERYLHGASGFVAEPGGPYATGL